MDEAFLMRLCYLFIAAIDADYDKLEIEMQLSFEINEYFIRIMPQAWITVASNAKTEFTYSDSNICILQ